MLAISARAGRVKGLLGRCAFPILTMVLLRRLADLHAWIAEGRNVTIVYSPSNDKGKVRLKVKVKIGEAPNEVPAAVRPLLSSALEPLRALLGEGFVAADRRHRFSGGHAFANFWITSPPSSPGDTGGSEADNCDVDEAPDHGDGEEANGNSEDGDKSRHGDGSGERGPTTSTPPPALQRRPWTPRAPDSKRPRHRSVLEFPVLRGPAVIDLVARDGETCFGIYDVRQCHSAERLAARLRTKPRASRSCMGRLRR